MLLFFIIYFTLGLQERITLSRSRWPWSSVCPAPSWLWHSCTWWWRHRRSWRMQWTGEWGWGNQWSLEHCPSGWRHLKGKDVKECIGFDIFLDEVLPIGSSSLPSGLSPSWKPGMMMKYIGICTRRRAVNPKIPSLPTTFKGWELYLAINFSSYTNWQAAIIWQLYH